MVRQQCARLHGQIPRIRGDRRSRAVARTILTPSAEAPQCPASLEARSGRGGSAAGATAPLPLLHIKQLHFSGGQKGPENGLWKNLARLDNFTFPGTVAA